MREVRNEGVEAEARIVDEAYRKSKLFSLF
jgi:hypothetical protein